MRRFHIRMVEFPAFTCSSNKSNFPRNVPNQNTDSGKRQNITQQRKAQNNYDKKYKKKQNTIDINITQMMAGKQWVKNWGMHRWAGEASMQVKEASSNNGYEAESKAF